MWLRGVLATAKQPCAPLERALAGINRLKTSRPAGAKTAEQLLLHFQLTPRITNGKCFFVYCLLVSPARVVFDVEALLQQLQISFCQVKIGSRDYLLAFVAGNPIYNLRSVCP